MKRTILKISILLTLAAPAPVLAEAPSLMQDLFVDIKPAAPEPIEIPPPPPGPALIAPVLLEPAPPATDIDTVIADTQDNPEAAVKSVVDESNTTEEITSDKPCKMHGKGMKYAGKGRDGKGMRGKHRDSCKAKHKGHHCNHAQLVQRLDMLDARMAKIEAMLESLLRR